MQQHSTVLMLTPPPQKKVDYVQYTSARNGPVWTAYTLTRVIIDLLVLLRLGGPTPLTSAASLFCSFFLFLTSPVEFVSSCFLFSFVSGFFFPFYFSPAPLCSVKGFEKMPGSWKLARVAKRPHVNSFIYYTLNSTSASRCFIGFQKKNKK